MKILTSRLLLVVLLALQGCISAKDQACYTSQEGVSGTMLQIAIPGSSTEYDNNNPETLWKDLGVSVARSENISLQISGVIDTCAKDGVKGSEHEDVLLPAFICSDGSIPVYGDNRQEINPEVLCRHGGGAISNEGKYIDSGMRISTGNYIKFDLIKNEIGNIDCGNLPRGVISDDKDYCEKSFKNLAANVDVTNDFSPYGNKYFYPGSTSNWISGNLLDIRKEIPDIRNKVCTIPVSSSITKHNTYLANYHCNRICSNNIYSNNCIFTTIYSRKATYGLFNTADVDEMLAESTKAYLPNVVIKIGDDNTSLDSFGAKCFPNEQGNTKCYENALRANSQMLLLGKSYDVGNVPKDSHVHLALVARNGYEGSAGGYHLRVTKSCVAGRGNGLYMYISQSGQPPKHIRPGDTGTYELSLQGNTYKYIVNSDNPPKSGKIFIGIRNPGTKYVDESTNNFYRVQTWKKSNPVHVTAIIVAIRDLMLDLFYGESAIPISQELGGNLDLLIGEDTGYKDRKSLINEFRGLGDNDIQEHLEDIITKANAKDSLSSGLREAIEFTRYKMQARSGFDSASNAQVDLLLGELSSVVSSIHGDPEEYRNNFVNTLSELANILNQRLASSTEGAISEAIISHVEMLNDILTPYLDRGGSAAGAASAVRLAYDSIKDKEDEPWTDNLVAGIKRASASIFSLSQFTDNSLNDPHEDSGRLGFDSMDLKETASSLYQAINIDRDAIWDVRDGGVIKSMYNGLTGRQALRGIQALLILYISISAILFLLGTIKAPAFDICIRLVKFGIVIQLLSPQGFDFFNNYLFRGIYQGTQYLISVVSGHAGSGTDFKFLDNTLGIMLTKETWMKILSFLFSGPVSFICMIIIIMAFWKFLEAMFTGIVMYFLSILAVSFLIAVCPIFICAILFQRTKPLFEGWMKAIINYALQPVFFFAIVAILNEAQVYFLHALTDFSACHKCVIQIDLKIFKMCLFTFLMPLGSTSVFMSGDKVPDPEVYDTALDIGYFGLPIAGVFVFLFYIVSHVMERFVHISQSITQALTNSMGGLEGDAKGGGARKAVDAIKGIAGKSSGVEAAVAKAKGKYKGKTRQNIEFKGKAAQRGGPTGPGTGAPTAGGGSGAGKQPFQASNRKVGSSVGSAAGKPHGDGDPSSSVPGEIKPGSSEGNTGEQGDQFRSVPTHDVPNPGAATPPDGSDELFQPKPDEPPAVVVEEGVVVPPGGINPSTATGEGDSPPVPPAPGSTEDDGSTSRGGLPH